MLVCFCFELAVAEQMSTKCRHIFFFGEYTISNDLSYDNLCDSFSFSFSSVQFSRSVVSESLRPHDHSMPGLPIHHQFQESTQTHLHWVGDAIQSSHPLSSPSPPAFSLSQIPGLSIESALCIRWPKYWSFSFNISPSNEHPGLISFRMDWLGLFAVQGTLKSLLQHELPSFPGLLYLQSWLLLDAFK